LAALLRLPVETIGTHFGGIPSGLPAPRLPEISWARLQEALPSALSFALLGSIESLLSAVVADSMSGARHRSNMELIAQGVATLLRTSWEDAAVVLATFGLTLFEGLTEGIIAGFCLSALVFLRRMAGSAAVEEDDDPDWAPDGDVVAVRITGAFFFGSAGVV